VAFILLTFGANAAADGTGSIQLAAAGAAIAVGNLSGGPARTLTKPSEFGAYCDWRPTGNEVLFTTYDLGLFGDLSHWERPVRNQAGLAISTYSERLA